MSDTLEWRYIDDGLIEREEATPKALNQPERLSYLRYMIWEGDYDVSTWLSLFGAGNKGFDLMYGPYTLGNFSSIEEAKAAAQKDYHKRILKKEARGA